MRDDNHEEYKHILFHIWKQKQKPKQTNKQNPA